MNDWAETVLGKLCAFQAGDAFAKDKQGSKSGDVPFIKVSDMNVYGNEHFINTATNWLSNAESKKFRKHSTDATVFAKIGEALRANRRRILTCPTIIDNNMMSATAFEGVNKRWLFYLLQTIDFNEVSRGSALPYLAVTDLKRIPVLAPKEDEQREIASVLSALDDKIESNRRLNETLEALARAIFTDWSLTFGPTRRKMAGATDPVSILGGLISDPAKAAPLAALFPDSFGEGGLPEGWENKGLDEVACFLNGIALQKFPPTGDNDLPVIKIAELRGGITPKTNRANRTIANRYLINDGDFLFSWSGSLMAKFWTEGEGALNQHLFKVFSTTHPRWFYSQWVYHHMDEFRMIAASKATTMGHIQRGHLSAASVVVPPPPTLEMMTAIVEPLIERTIHNDLENRTLTETRDYLLPKLMCGAVRVRDAAAMAK